MDKIMDILSSMSAMAAAKEHGPSSEEERCSERVLELAKKLDELKIPYKKRNLFGCVDQLVFEWGGGSDIVCHIGSYGHEQGLFEVMGKDLMTKEELERESVAGNIKMEDAVARIKKAYEKTKEQVKTDFFRPGSINSSPFQINLLFLLKILDIFKVVRGGRPEKKERGEK